MPAKFTSIRGPEMMKIQILMLLLGFLSIAAAQSPFTLETDTELTSGGDFNGDGLRDLAVVDRVSGAFRILSQAADGSFTAGEARPTGVPDPAALGVGKLLSPGPDTLVVTAPAWNGVNLLVNLDPPVVAPQTGLGPSAIAVLDVPAPGFPSALDDLMVASSLDGPPDPNGISLIRAMSVSQELISEPSNPSGAVLSRGRKVYLKTGLPAFGGFMASSASGSEFQAYEAAGNALVSPTIATALLADADYAYGFFDPASPLSQFAFYTRGTTTLDFRSVSEPTAGTFEFGPTTVYDLGAPIHLASTIPFTGGAWLLVLFNGGINAGLYNFDRQNAPALRQSFTPPEGQSFTGGFDLGTGNLVFIHGTGGRSSGWQRFNFDGTSHAAAGAGSWQPNQLPSFASTVFVFSAEPFINPDARLIHLFKAGDWTSAITGAGGSRIANALSYLGGTVGLGSPFDTPLTPFGAGEFAVPNQYQPAISIASLAAFSGNPRPGVTFSPVAGEYDASLLDPDLGFPVILATDPSSSVIHYRLSASAPWILYDGPISLKSDTTIETYAGTAPAPTSPISRGTYKFAVQPALGPAAPVDLNGNGLGDAWEKTFANSDPAGNPDGDAATNLEEYLAGTDPNDPSSFPPGLLAPGCAPVIFIRIEKAGSANPMAVVYWPSVLANTILQTSIDLKVWTTVTAGIAANGSFNEWRTPANNRQFFRLGTDAHGPACELLLLIRTEAAGGGGMNVVLTWPAALLAATLESSSDLINWSPIINGIGRDGAFLEWKEPASNRRFFRLRR